MYPEPITAAFPNYNRYALPLAGLAREPHSLAANYSTPNRTRVVSTAQHLSQIVYAVPAQRLRAILPIELTWQGFGLVESNVKGTPHGWLSVVSYLDQPLGGLGAAANPPFEQTAYRIALTRQGEIFHWLLNLSVGSLAAVGQRQLWALPWHLSAMELRSSFDERAQQYQNYRFQMQSEPISAIWTIADTGSPMLELDAIAQADLLAQASVQDCFVRRDQQIGTRKTQLRWLTASRGRLLNARCDWLERLGILNETELHAPHSVWLSRAVGLEQDAPMILRETAESFTSGLRAAA